MGLQYCFWVEGTFTFLAYVWGIHYFWEHPSEPVWGGLRGKVFAVWLLCELCAAGCFGIVTYELWDSRLVDWSVLMTYSIVLVGEGLWMLFTVWRWVEWNRTCLYLVSVAAALLAFEVAVAQLSVFAMWPGIYLALHTTCWNAYFWMNTWEAEVKGMHFTEESLLQS